MPSLRRFLTRRWLLALLAVVALFGLAMLHPYPRQSLFGPKIRGEPWCYWEAEVRRHADPEKHENTVSAKLLRWIGMESEPVGFRTLINHPEMLPLILEMLEGEEQAIRWQILLIFPMCESLHDPSALAVVRRRLNDDDPDRRVQAATALWHVAR